MKNAQLAITIAPMLVVAWVRTFSVVLPGLIETFDLSLDQAGLCITVLEVGGVLAMLSLGFAMDRIGAIRLVSGCLVLGSGALLLSVLSPSYEGLLACFFLVGAGCAASASLVNALIAAVSARRNFYLGITHLSFGVCSIVAPLVAGAVIAVTGWRAYYGLVCLAGMVTALIFHWNTRDTRAAWHPPVLDDESTSVREVLRRIGPVCIGVSGLVGVQGVFNSWSYLYAVDRFEVDHAWATLAPACIWCGIVVSRGILTVVTSRVTARNLLIVSCLIVASATHWAGLTASFWQAGIALIAAGMGVGGAYQLGTAWAVERAPWRIGAASTFVMAAAALGAGIWTWINGVVVESHGYAAMPWVVSSALAVGVIAFAFVPSQGVRS